jgi:hypothetical protein
MREMGVQRGIVRLRRRREGARTSVRFQLGLVAASLALMAGIAVLGERRTPERTALALQPAADRPEVGSALPVSGVWRVRWSDGATVYEGLLSLEGNRGGLRLRYADADGAEVVVHQDIEREQVGAETLLTGQRPTSGDTGEPARHAPDRAYVRLDASGQIAARFCKPSGTCHPAVLEPEFGVTGR